MRNRKVCYKILILFGLHGCAAPFGSLPYNANTIEKVDAHFSNKEEINPFVNDENLWSLIKKDAPKTEDSLNVRIKIIQYDAIEAKLIRNDSIIDSLYIKGRLESDGCFYTKRNFFAIPLFPILWTYHNNQKRFYLKEESLVVEVTSNEGSGCALWGGSHKFNDAWEYKLNENNK